MNDFSKKIAVVTGGASGIGRSLVKELLAAGAKVVIGDVEQAALDRVTAEFADAGDILGVVTDVSNPDSVNALADKVYDSYGACHLLFNNAGVAAPSANVWETTANDWTWVHGVNVYGVVHGIQAFVPRMIASGEEGYVINTSSGDGGVSPLPYQSVYASSKAASGPPTETGRQSLPGKSRTTPFPPCRISRRQRKPPAWSCHCRTWTNWHVFACRVFASGASSS